MKIILPNFLKSKAFIIEKRGDEFCLLSKDGTQVLGCHPTRAEAEAQERAIQASKNNAEELDFVAFAFFQPVGVSITIGKVTGSSKMAIHSVIFDKEAFDLVSARSFLNGQNFFTGDEFLDRANEFEYEVRPSDNFDPRSIKRVERPKSFAELEEFAKHPAPNSGRIDSVEIFRTGIWNGDNYNVKDLLDIVKAVEGVGFNPPVKLGHKEISGGMAFGWVENIRIVFDDAKNKAARLVADFVDMPKDLVTLIKERRFDAVSSEIFWNFERDGKTFRRVLKAVALLGAETPGVGNLKPLHGTVEFGDGSWDSVHAYTVQPKRRAKMKLKTLADCSKRLEEISAALKDEQDADKREELFTEQSEVSTRIVELSAIPPEGGENGEDNSGIDAIAFRKMQDEMTEMRTELAASGERERSARVENKVSALRIPVLRDHIAAIYDLISKTPDTKVRFFVSQDDKGIKKYDLVDAVTVVDDLVDRLNKSTEKLFATLGHSGDLIRDDEPPPDNSGDAGVELDRLTKAYMVKHDIKDENYAKAFTIVCDEPENAELKAQYAGTEV